MHTLRLLADYRYSTMMEYVYDVVMTIACLWLFPENGSAARFRVRFRSGYYYTRYSRYYYTYYTYYYSGGSTIAGAVAGSVIFVTILVIVIIWFCVRSGACRSRSNRTVGTVVMTSSNQNPVFKGNAEVAPPVVAVTTVQPVQPPPYPNATYPQPQPINPAYPNANNAFVNPQYT